MPTALEQLLKGRQLTFTSSPVRQRRSLPRARHFQHDATRRAIQPVGPLLNSIRDQEAPYNNLCPYWTNDDGRISSERCLSGCVATSIEQVMAYYRYPTALQDTLHGWSTANYTLDDLLPGTRFDWDNYLLDYRDGWTEAQGQAIALTSLAAGMAVHMKYGLSSSGANTSLAVEPLKRAFGYGTARYFYKILYTPDRWHAMMQYELQQGRPIVYTGHNMAMSGHAFNVDGVDAQGFYHINWGWNGDYDGWYDLDWLNPWEPTDTDPQGIVEGLFCNQGALLMHPSADAQPLPADSLDIDQLGITLDRVTFLRSPDVQMFTAADFTFTNSGPDEVCYTYEVMSYLPTDTAVFLQADYVGLSAITLKPSETRTQRVYLRFTETGDRILGISHDDLTIPFTMPVQVSQGTKPQLAWGEATAVFAEASDNTLSATFTVPVSNTATAGVAGNLVTFCLHPDAHDNEDLRHWTVLSLPGGSEQDLQVTFNHLEPSTAYTFIVRCPWTVQAQLSFTTPTLTGISSTPAMPRQEGDATLYDLSGRPAAAASRGLLVGKGHKRAVTTR